MIEEIDNKSTIRPLGCLFITNFGLPLVTGEVEKIARVKVTIGVPNM